MVEVTRAESWDAMRAAHRWQVPQHYNIAWDVCERWARTNPDRLALLYLRPDGQVRNYSYAQLARAARRLANALAEHGLRRGDRISVLLPQMPETIITHIAAYMMGAVVVPVFTLFGEDALEYRLADSGARMAVTDAANLPKLMAVRDRLPDLGTVFSVDRPGDGAWGFWQELGKARDDFTVAKTGPDDPAFISYTSGTTGPPKGALHGHRVLLGHVPAVTLTHEFFPQAGDRAWTPADWAWIGGLCNMALPALRAGVTLVAHRMEKFDPERAFDLTARHEVRNSFIPPTALRMMRTVPDPARFGARLRSVGSGGEALGAEMIDWGREALGLTINEFYGQTECNLVLGNCASVMEVRPGSMGKPFPGSEVAILGPDGEVLGPGATGEIAIRRGDPAMFLEYWKQPAKTAEKFVGDWMLTGDEGRVDDDGYFFYASRTDDVITSAGYRIGPSEIETCLAGHPSVALAACIGVPDPVRTEIVKAYVTLKPGAEPSDALVDELKALVRTRISPHVAPRAVAFIDQMPVTATGKIMRRELRAREKV
ncbi:AMP-binding protein [Limibaculum sp. M0105]|uniref:AMP-binding protein n=1 Tax=Thermohalobaculum xanthum TaxID=2753746 RepID=A0A8J7MA91_9RHOB|nr:AMP-binding protein [Thermohalobaculum xanthum]MBK0400477.1 AMP-binding protein [Thermohalobaculum xanthum]